MSKRYDLTEEQFFKLRFRYTKVVVSIDIIFLLLCIFFVIYLFFANYGVLRSYNIAWYITAAAFFACVRNIFSFLPQILAKGRRGGQFYSQWVLLCYGRLPQWLKKAVDREGLKKPGMQPAEALLHFAHKMKIVSHIFLLAALICLAIGLYRLSQNLQTLSILLYYRELLENVS